MNARRILAAAVAAIAVTLSVVQAQQSRDQFQAPKSGTASISGVILSDDTTPQPLKRAQVLVMNAESQFTKTAYTNETGRFSLTGLPAGRYSLTASKSPYLRLAYGAKRWDRPGTPITLKEGAQMNDVTMRLPRGAVLGGVIIDENGQPAFGVNVRVMQVRMQNGERTFVQAGVGNALGESTDDRGQYRVFGLPPGDYVVAASPRIFSGEVRAMTEAEIRAVMQALQQQQQAAAPQTNPGLAAAGTAKPAPTPTPSPTETVTVGFANVYYPGTTTPAMASTVTLGPGEERLGVDFPMKLVRTARVEGTVIVPSNVRPQSVQLMLSPSVPASGPQIGGAGIEMLTFNRATPDAEGKFSFTAVPPGQYSIVARANAGGPPPPPPPPPPPGAAGGGQAVMEFRTISVNGAVGGEPLMMMPPMGGGDPNAAVFWGQTDVSVDGTALSGITVPLQPGMTITGRIAFKATRLTPETDLSRVRLNLAPAQTSGPARLQLGVPSVVVEPNGQFRITGVTPGRYRLQGVMPLPPGSAPGLGWAMLSAVAKGQDVLDFPLDIGPNDEIKDVVVTFTDAAQEINGTLQDVTGRPAPDYTIVVFSEDKRFWTAPSRRIRSTRPGTDGKFAVAGLPPGEYRIAALIDVAPGEINDPSFLEQVVSASVKISLADGERKTQDLRIAGGL
ncbi:MAG TPA: carboxypeptidase-like regulatory domain-containing protein [Vicinamibacterales bacterium]|nr:carboxypeptidase-like regulatory domain-containing protein [Vicinamibacterales bacterium]